MELWKYWRKVDFLSEIGFTLHFKLFTWEGVFPGARIYTENINGIYICTYIKENIEYVLYFML